MPSPVGRSALTPRIGQRSDRARQNAHLFSGLPRPKSGGGTIPGHTRDGGQTTATMGYAGPILPGFRETAWIQKSPYFHRAAKHGRRAYHLYNHMLMPGLSTGPVEGHWHLRNHVPPL